MELKDVRTIISWLKKLPIREGWLEIGANRIFFLHAPSYDGEYYGIVALRLHDPMIISEKEI